MDTYLVVECWIDTIFPFHKSSVECMSSMLTPKTKYQHTVYKPHSNKSPDMFIDQEPKLRIIPLPLPQIRLIFRIVPSNLSSNSSDEHIRDQLCFVCNIIPVGSPTIWTAATVRSRATSIVARTAVRGATASVVV